MKLLLAGAAAAALLVPAASQARVTMPVWDGGAITRACDQGLARAHKAIEARMHGPALAHTGDCIHIGHSFGSERVMPPAAKVPRHADVNPGRAQKAQRVRQRPRKARASG